MKSVRHHIVFKKLKEFFSKYQIDGEKKFVLCVSGGRDSMALMSLFVELRNVNEINHLRAIHFNHQARLESKFEAIKMREVFEQYKIPFEIVDLELKTNEGSFEQVAREARYNYLQNNLGKDEICAFGHHLDDHFEWAMMRFFRSGENNFLKGMPHYRHPFFRPLSEVTREEINNFVSLFNINYFEDATNQECDADRNYIRNMLTPLIKQRFPKFLEYYQTRKNETLAYLEHGQVEKTTGLDSPLIFNKHNAYSIFHFKKDLTLNDLNEIKETIKSLSLSQRGAIDREAQKLISAFNANKTGPMQFSGQVFCWLNKPFLIFYRHDSLPFTDVLKIDSIATLGNKNDFLNYLLTLKEVSPFVTLGDISSRELKILKTRKIPGGLTLLDNVFSIGDIYNALSSK